jgi:hypothetical protein
MAETLCGKLAECGVTDPSASGLCALFGQSLTTGDPDLADALRSGRCTYDAGAAATCLRAVGGISCDTGADPARLFAMADGLVGCSRAYTCN